MRSHRPDSTCVPSCIVLRVPVHLVQHPIAQDALIALRDKARRVRATSGGSTHRLSLVWRSRRRASCHHDAGAGRNAARDDGGRGARRATSSWCRCCARAWAWWRPCSSCCRTRASGTSACSATSTRPWRRGTTRSCPPDLSASTALIVDPMLATGGSAVAAIDARSRPARATSGCVCIVAAPEGIAAVEAAHPDVPHLHAGRSIASSTRRSSSCPASGISGIACMAPPKTPVDSPAAVRRWATALTSIEPNQILVRGYRARRADGPACSSARRSTCCSPASCRRRRSAG